MLWVFIAANSGEDIFYKFYLDGDQLGRKTYGVFKSFTCSQNANLVKSWVVLASAIWKRILPLPRVANDVPGAKPRLCLEGAE